MSLKVYLDLMSQPCRALYMFLKVTNIPFQTCLVKLREGEHLQDSYKQIHPFSKVPAIDDNGFKIIESVAILRYLAQTRKVADHWYPSDVKQQAKIDEYLEWQHLNTRIYCAMFFQHKFLRPMMFQKPADEKKVAKFQEEMQRCLQDIESVWLAGGKNKFIASDKISAADLWACAELEQPVVAGFDVFAKYPIIGAYRERVRKETGPAYEEAHKVARIMLDKFKGVPVLGKK